MQVWQLEPSVTPDDPATVATLHDSHPWRLVLRALLLTLTTGVFLILMASVASALDVPDATGVAGGATEGTTGTVAGTATDTVADTTDAVTGTTGAATRVVDDAVAGAAGTAEVVGDLTRDVVGTAEGAVGDGVALVDDIADSALGGVSSTLDPVTKTIDGVVSGMGDGLSEVPIPDLTAPDPIPIPPTGSSEPATDPPGHRSLIERGPVSGTAATTTTDVHLAQTDVLRADPGGAVPGLPSNGGFPSPLDVAAAAMRGLSEAGGSSLVLWALVALVGLLPVMDDRWLRFVRPVSPRAPLVALDGRPG